MKKLFIVVNAHYDALSIEKKIYENYANNDSAEPYVCFHEGEFTEELAQSLEKMYLEESNDIDSIFYSDYLEIVFSVPCKDEIISKTLKKKRKLYKLNEQLSGTLKVISKSKKNRKEVCPRAHFHSHKRMMRRVS